MKDGLLYFGVVTYMFIFLRAFQQLNVFHDRRGLVVPTSMCMQACEVYLVLEVVKTASFWLIIAGGLGGGLGTLTAMYIHRMRNERAGNQVHRENT